MDKASIKSNFKVEAKGIDIMSVVAEARENVKAEVKQNSKGDMTRKERARARVEAKMKGA